jgi:hypothetical protein
MQFFLPHRFLKTAPEPLFPLSFLLLLCAFFTLGAQPSTAGQIVPPLQLPAVASLSVDLDGDGITDPIRRERYGLQERASFTLSRSGAFSVVPFVPATSEHTFLSAQDVDGDGDVDLLWGNLLHFAISLVCFNDGFGHFECLSPPRPGTLPTPHRAGVTHFQVRGFERMLSTSTTPSDSSARKPASLQGVLPVLAPQQLRHEPQCRSRSSVGSLTAPRAPPPQRVETRRTPLALLSAQGATPRFL